MGIITALKPIETRYKGYRFRSRLEARWAVFFDHLHIKYSYEPDGYELPNGERYLPDFQFYSGRDGQIPTDLFGEVKPIAGDDTQFVKARSFIESAPEDSAIICLGGLPDTLTYPVFQVYEGAVHDSDVAINGDWKYAPWYWCVGNSAWEDWTKLEILDNEGITFEAVLAARSARFEFGESGAA